MASSSNPRIDRIPQDLHFVSRAVLRGFCDEDEMLMRLDVRHPNTSPRLRSRKAVGYRNDLQPLNPDEFESHWQPMERNLPKAMDAVRDKTVLDDGQLVDVLRDCLAVHFARSNTLETIAQALRQPVLAEMEAKVRESPDLVSPEGLVPVGQAARAAMARRTIKRVARERFRHEAIAPERMVATYKKVKPMLAGYGVEVLVAQEGEFIIGDTPAHTFNPQRGIDLPLDEALTMVMPIERYHAVALGPVNTYTTITRDILDMINRMQVVTARSMVAWHPEAKLEEYVRRTLTKMSEGDS